MKIDFFIIKQYLKWLRPNAKIGFVIDSRIMPTYDNALASIRTRCYDIMNELERRQIRAEIYRPGRKYDVVIFTKTYSCKAYKIACTLYNEGVHMIMDVWCEFSDDIRRREDVRRLLKMVELSDCVVTASEQQQILFGKYHNVCMYIPESICEDIIRYAKKHEEKKRKTLIWCGYSAKAKDMLCIKEVLNELIETGNYEVLIVSEKDPMLKEIPYRYIKYNNRYIGRQMCEGDIFIAPRDLEGGKNSAHSIYRISIPMAVGLPVIGSRVPSYQSTPIDICENNEEWFDKIISYSVVENRVIAGERNREYILNNISTSVVCNKYLEVIDHLDRTKAES